MGKKSIKVQLITIWFTEAGAWIVLIPWQSTSCSPVETCFFWTSIREELEFPSFLDTWGQHNPSRNRCWIFFFCRLSSWTIFDWRMACISWNRRGFVYHLLFRLFFVILGAIDSSCTPFALSCCLLEEDQDFVILKKALLIKHCHLFCCLCLCHHRFHFLLLKEINLYQSRSFQHLQMCRQSQT